MRHDDDDGIDRRVQEIQRHLPPSTWDVHGWRGGAGAEACTVDVADARRIVRAVITADDEHPPTWFPVDDEIVDGWRSNGAPRDRITGPGDTGHDWPDGVPCGNEPLLRHAGRFLAGFAIGYAAVTAWRMARPRG